MFSAACRIIARLALAAALCVWARGASAADSGRGQTAPATSVPPSRLEAAYSDRAGLPLRQFGYDLFSRTEGGSSAGGAPVGGVQGDYVLGVGDELQIVLRGDKPSVKRVPIDREGRLVVDDLPPILAAGRPLAEVRGELAALARASLRGTEIYLSLAELRRINVLVVGEVARPGRYALTSLGTALDALLAAGGIDRGGSLRRLSVVRAGAAEPRPIDLYEVLLAGRGAADLRLDDGDRLVVPPLGPTVAIAGAMRRPAIYELPATAATIPVAALEALSGGPLRPGARRALRLALAPDGTEQPIEVAEADRATAPLGDGDVVIEQPLHESRIGEVYLDGHVRRPGPRALAEQPSVGTLVLPEDLLPRPYPPFAAVETTEPESGARTLVAVDLSAVFTLHDDRALADGDTLIVLGARDVDFLTARPVLELLRGRPPPRAAACAGLSVLARALSADPGGALAAGALARAAATLTPAEGACPPVFDRHPDLLTFALRHSALVTAGVARPGFYPVASPSGAARLARTAAGGARDVGTGDAGSADILDSAEPRVELIGPFRHPGARPLTRARGLRDVLGSGADLEAGVYGLLGVIDRFERPGLARRLIPFSPREVATGHFSLSLADRDRVILFSTEEIRRLLDRADAAEPGYVRTSGLGNGPGPGRGRSESADTGSVDGQPSPPAAAAPLPPAVPDESSAETDPSAPGKNPPAWERDTALLTLARGHTVTVRGAVARPGGYPVGAPTPPLAVIEAAGGLTPAADPAAVELTTDTPGGPGRALVDLGGVSGAGALVGPGDSLRVGARVQALEARGVVVEGEVQHPGTYDLMRGETLSSVLTRAGGPTPEAYTAGAVFTRESARRRDTEGFQRTAQTIEGALAAELFRPGSAAATHPEAVAAARQLASQFRAARGVGRVTVEADPGALRARPWLDILLEPGDRLVIPKRAPLVAVSGEVQAPSTLQYDPAKRAEDYLDEAGGFTRNADEDRAFVLLPNGSSRPLAVSAWKHGDTTIPPGSTIVVPRDPHPFDFLEAARDIGGALGQLALTAASISVIGRP